MTDRDRLMSEAERLAAEVEALRAAISWVEPPFVTDATPEPELRKRIRFLLDDAARAAALRREMEGEK